MARRCIRKIASLGRGAGVGPSERAVTRLENNLEIWTPKKTSVIGVRYSGATPEAAQRVVAAVLDTYRNEHVRLHRTERSYGFFDEQKRLLQDKLAQAHDELRDAKNRAGVTSIESQQLTIQDEVRAIEAQLVASQSELAASEAKVGALKKALDAVPAKLVTQDVVGFPNQAADAMRDSLFKLQATQSEMQSRYTADHPLMIAMNEQIKRLQATLDEQPKQRNQSTTAVHPGHQQLELAWLTEQAALASLQARVTKLDARTCVGHRSSQGSEPAQGKRRSHVQRAAPSRSLGRPTIAPMPRSSNRLRHRSATRKTEQISNVNILEPATYVAKAASPNRLLVGGLGLILALSGSVLICLLADYNDHSLKTPDDVEKSLELPVLMSIPRLAKESVSWSRRGKEAD